jgi:hypothetical protein
VRDVVFNVCELHAPGEHVLVSGVRLLEGDFGPVTIIDVLTKRVDLFHPGIEFVAPCRVEDQKVRGKSGLPAAADKALVDQGDLCACFSGFDGGKTASDAASDNEDVRFSDICRCHVLLFSVQHFPEIISTI